MKYISATNLDAAELEQTFTDSYLTLLLGTQLKAIISSTILSDILGLDILW